MGGLGYCLFDNIIQHYLCLHLCMGVMSACLQGVPYIPSDNRITQNFLAFSRITGNSKQDFMFMKK